MLKQQYSQAYQTRKYNMFMAKMSTKVNNTPADRFLAC